MGASAFHQENIEMNTASIQSCMYVQACHVFYTQNMLCIDIVQQFTLLSHHKPSCTKVC